MANKGILVPTAEQEQGFVARMAKDNLQTTGFTGAPAVPEGSSLESGMLFRFYPVPENPEDPQPNEHQVRVRLINGNRAEYCNVIAVTLKADKTVQSVEVRQFFPRITGRRLTIVNPDGSTKTVESSGNAAIDLRTGADYNQSIDVVREKCKQHNAWIRVILDEHQNVKSRFATTANGLTTGYTGVYQYVDEKGNELDTSKW